jgi:hypothetical protein
MASSAKHAVPTLASAKGVRDAMDSTAGPNCGRTPDRPQIAYARRARSAGAKPSPAGIR